MTDLTEKILSLDLETVLELNNANAVSIETKKEADLHAEQRMEEVQQEFEKEKESEAVQRAKDVKEDRKRVLDNLQKKMKTFDEEMKIDILVKDLVSIARDRICF
jgi:phosphoenolpyruvate-protein kinase (PTS system EI component)